MHRPHAQKFSFQTREILYTSTQGNNVKTSKFFTALQVLRSHSEGKVWKGKIVVQDYKQQVIPKMLVTTCQVKYGSYLPLCFQGESSLTLSGIPLFFFFCSSQRQENIIYTGHFLTFQSAFTIIRFCNVCVRECVCVCVCVCEARRCFFDLK